MVLGGLFITLVSVMGASNCREDIQHSLTFSAPNGAFVSISSASMAARTNYWISEYHVWDFVAYHISE